ncbi:pirin family protein [Mycobacteroides abscessus subsp. bolletii]|uniref:pirin family protein n=1 Tax=Mycobacteroides abscessus TaxID=36809 RepID=UPI0019D20187|nr:pirin family protein [Mycobacteroides abscessus]MBN7300798.1 pirin family protein [Mycobacteroides abscessus subsp. bolletii]
MSNADQYPAELNCRPMQGRIPDYRSGPELLAAREVPLGGTRSMTVFRTIPQRRRSFVGAWCFADRYGPDDVSLTAGMDVPPHPHAGLQTVSWLFQGEVEHRDSIGTESLVKPGELNLMTAGSGIAHSEVSTRSTTVLHGMQLWTVLPKGKRNIAPAFEHYVPPLLEESGLRARVFMGSLLSQRSPVQTATPLVGAELIVEPQHSIEIPVDDTFEHCLVIDAGPIYVRDVRIESATLAYFCSGQSSIPIKNPSAKPARVMLLGGTPIDEDIVMWWNFIGETHEDIVALREEWQQHSNRFGEVAGYQGQIQHLPAPALPNSKLLPRVNPST